MKPFEVLLLFVAMAATSCGPSRHAVHVEMRYPSKAGIELAGKNISVVYLLNKDKTAADFNSYMADGFAYALEEEYGTVSRFTVWIVLQQEITHIRTHFSIF